MKSTLDSEELHRLVFSNEKGFLEQSEAFRKSLSSDSDEDAKREAEILRRGVEYRKQQEEAMTSVLQEMEELEKIISSKEEVIQRSPMQENVDGKDGNRSSINLCSKCSCVLSPEEVMHEQKAGRSQAHQMICRLCQVENMRIKKGSPYLMGRVDRNGRPFPAAGLSSLQEDRMMPDTGPKLRRIGPMTEDYSISMGEIPSNRQNTESDSNTWREQFTNAMTQQRGVLPNNRPPINNAPLAMSSKENSTAITPSHDDHRGRYSKRPIELQNRKESYTSVSVWEAQYRAAIYRQQAASPALPNNHVTTASSADSQLLQKDTEIRKLLARIHDLENILTRYKEQLDASSQPVKSLQSMRDGTHKSETNDASRRNSSNPRDAYYPNKGGVGGYLQDSSKIAKGKGEGTNQRIGQPRNASTPYPPTKNNERN